MPDVGWVHLGTPTLESLSCEIGHPELAFLLREETASCYCFMSVNGVTEALRACSQGPLSSLRGRRINNLLSPILIKKFVI